MPVNIGEIVSTIQSCVAGSPTDQELAQLSGAITNIEAGDVYSVACTALLPDAAENTGRWVYVSDTRAYRYSNGEEWVRDYDSTCVITGNQLWVWGQNDAGSAGGHAGTGFNKYTSGHCRYSSPVQEFCSNNTWCFIDLMNQAQAIKTDGTLWAWGGINDMGQLGKGSNGCVCSPVQEVCSATNWCFVSSSGGQTGLGLKTDGTLWGWGNRMNLWFIYGSTTPFAVPCPVQDCCSMTDVACVSGGYGSHVVIAKTDGTIWSGGCNHCGQVGNNSTITDHNAHFIQEITSSTNWCGRPIAGAHRSVVLKTDGTLWNWGANCCGNLGNNTNNLCHVSSPVQEISSSTNWSKLATAMFSLRSGAIKTDGTFWMWGSDEYGSAWSNCGTSVYNSSPVQEFTSSTNWCDANVHHTRTHAIKTDGTLWSGGYNHCTNSHFGIYDFTCKSSPVQEQTSGTSWSMISSSQWGNIGALLALTKGFNEP